MGFTKYKKDAQTSASSHLLSILAGRESDGWRPLIADFIQIALKLEKLGFIYNKGNVIILNPEEESDD